MISVRRARVLPLPSFRFRLTTDTLGFGYDLPAAGRSRDFHPLERALAGRTTAQRPGAYILPRAAFFANMWTGLCKSSFAALLLLPEGCVYFVLQSQGKPQDLGA